MMDIPSINVKNRTLLCILCSICPTIYVNKHLSRLTYGKAPAKGSNPVLLTTGVFQEDFHNGKNGVFLLFLKQGQTLL